MNILLSLKPQYADAMVSGKKRYEFRRVIFKNPNVKRIYVYVTSPIAKIVGVFEIGKILSGTPGEIWEKCRKYAGISAEAFFEYYKGCNKAFAITVHKFKRFLEPIDPYIKFQGFTPPQSFYYVSEEALAASRKPRRIQTVSLFARG